MSSESSTPAKPEAEQSTPDEADSPSPSPSASASASASDSLWSIETSTDLNHLIAHLSSSRSVFVSSLSRSLSLISTLYSGDHSLKAAKLHKFLAHQTASLINEIANQSGEATDSDRSQLESMRESLSHRRYRYISAMNSELEKLMENLRELNLIQGGHNKEQKSSEKASDGGGGGSGSGARKSADGWELISDSDGIKSYYRAEKDSPTHSFLVSGNVDTNVFNLLALIYELSLYQNWFPMVRKSAKIHHLSRFRLIGKTEVAALWPVADREVVLWCYGDVTDDGSIAIFTRSVRESDAEAKALDGVEEGKSQFSEEEKKAFQDAKAEAKGKFDAKEFDRLCQRHYEDFEDHSQWKIPDNTVNNVRAVMHTGGFILTPISPECTKVSACFNVDPKLSFIPQSLLNWFTSKLCGMLVKILRDQTAKWFGKKRKSKEENVYEKQIRENRYVYGEIERRLKLEMKHVVEEKEKEESKSQAK